MKKQILSTGVGLMLTLGMLLPLNHSFVNVGNPSTTQVNVNGGGCIRVLSNGTTVNICAGVQPQDVSWNSGGG